MAALSELARLLANTPDRPPTQFSPSFGTISGMMAPFEVPQTFPRFELYLDDAFEWRWHYRVSNYKIIADSGEGYKNYGDAVHAIELLRGGLKAPIHIGRDWLTEPAHLAGFSFFGLGFPLSDSCLGFGGV